MESEEDFVGYENNDNISDENAFIEDVDDDDSETMTRQETEETPVKKSRRSIVWKFFNLLENEKQRWKAGLSPWNKFNA